jgi:hypothetical protein
MTMTEMRRCEAATTHVEFPGTDLTVLLELNNSELSMTVNKAKNCVYRVVLEQATTPIENVWLLDMFIHDHRVRLSDLTAELEEYLASLNVSQG